MRDNSIRSLFQVITGQIHDQLALRCAVRFTGTLAALFISILPIGPYNGPTESVWTNIGPIYILVS